MDMESLSREALEPNPRFAETLQTLVNTVQEPLGLDRWNLHLKVAAIADARANCDASPEYREAYISFDFDKLLTGDDLSELGVHELAHCHTAPLGVVSWELAQALADSAPEYMREALRKLLERWVEIENERVTTDVAHVYLKLLRRAGILPTPQG